MKNVISLAVVALALTGCGAKEEEAVLATEEVAVEAPVAEAAPAEAPAVEAAAEVTAAPAAE